jgi:hypothetical protein
MQEDTQTVEFDLQTHLASKGHLDFDPEAAKPMVIMVPGRQRGKSISVRGESHVINVTKAMTDLLIDDVPYEHFPFVPQIVFDWSDASEETRAHIGTALGRSSILYDELDVDVEKEITEDDAKYSRVLAWYLITRTVGDFEIDARLRIFGERRDLETDPPPIRKMMASELVEDVDIGTIIIRNAYMTNFNKIGMRIVRAFMSPSKPDVRSLKRNFKGVMADYVRHMAECAYQKPKASDLWASHGSWLPVLLEFSNSTAAQRAVAFEEITSADNPAKTRISLGSRIIGGSYVDPGRDLLWFRYVAEPLLDMITRGLIECDTSNRMLALTDRGRKTADAFRPLEELLHSGEFRRRRGDVAPEKIDLAEGWTMELFTRMKAIADDLPANIDNAEQDHD